jgi:TfoX/Sxy family transcriptional regulator of competence genes
VKLPSADPKAVSWFEELTPVGPNVTTKLMFGQPAAFVNGNLFFGVFGAALFVRLSERDRTEADSLGGFGTFEPMAGHIMAGYLTLPSAFRTDRTRSRAWVDRARRFAEGLPPKRPNAKGKAKAR